MIMMTLINGFLSNFIFALLIHNVRVYTLHADIHYVDKIVRISGAESSNKDYEKHDVDEAQRSSSDTSEEKEQANPEQFCGWDTEEALSEKCRQVVNDPESGELYRYYVFLRRESPGRTQTYNMIQRSIFRRNKKVKACQCPTKPFIYLEYKSSESDQVTVYTERPKKKCPNCCSACEGQDRCDSCLICCEKSCKVMCWPCKCFVYSLAFIDYSLGRCICGEDYATRPCCAGAND